MWGDSNQDNVEKLEKNRMRQYLSLFSVLNIIRLHSKEGVTIATEKDRNTVLKGYLKSFLKLGADCYRNLLMTRWCHVAMPQTSPLRSR